MVGAATWKFSLPLASIKQTRGLQDRFADEADTFGSIASLTDEHRGNLDTQTLYFSRGEHKKAASDGGRQEFITASCI